jgi:diguanylate cyclase (GGDEF)-like protein
MMGVMAPVSPERLLAVIELQNAIAAAGLNADEVMGIVVERAGLITGATSGIVAIVEGDEVVYRSVSRPTTIALGMRQPREGTLLGRCVAEGTPIRIDDTAKDARIDAGTSNRLGAGSLVCVPLLYGESAVGVLEVFSVKPNAFTDEDVETLRLLAQTIAIALHRAYTYPRPRLDNTTDALTGLGNKRAYDERIQAELTRNRRYGHSFSLALLDVDGIETAIDRHGQAAGDEAVREIAGILRKNTRVIDGAFRIAADDFAIVMPGTSAEGARIVAERCRQHIKDAGLLDKTVTTSCGVVEAKDETADELAARAIAAVAGDKQPR